MSIDGSNPYNYDLLLQPDAIRILLLEPATTQEADLHATISIACLGENPLYEAISYTWGEPVFPEALHLSVENPNLDLHIHSKIQITENLASALRQFRRKNENRVLWADAVCINQLDNEEKASQVTLMKRIYKQAAQVLIWLGDNTPEMDSAFQFTEGLAARAKDEFDVKPRSYVIHLVPHKLECDRGHIEELLASTKSSHIHHIYGRPWFSRLWIVQEVALATKAVLCSGKLELDWMTFETAMTLLRESLDTVAGSSILEAVAFSQVWSIIEVKGDYRALNSGHVTYGSVYAQLGIFMQRLRQQDCKDDRDRVYALLGLQTPLFLSLHFKPDYTVTSFEVYTKFAWAHLEAGDVEILLDAGIWWRDISEVNLDQAPIVEYDPNYLPSWAPDLRKPKTPRWLCYRGDNDRFYASTEFLPKIKLSSQNIQTVAIWSAVVGQIRTQVYLEKNFMTQLINFQYIRNSIKMIQDQVEQVLEANKGGYITETLDDALARTLIADGAATTLKPSDVPNLWLLYSKHCLSSDGGVLQKYLQQAAFPPSAQFYSSLNPEEQEAWDFHTYLTRSLFGNTFFITVDGRIGLAPPGSQPGDEIVLIDGCRTPFLMRRLEGTLSVQFQRPYYSIVGPCYLHGVMYGEMCTDEQIEDRWGFTPII
ncbi:uncharacterized protein BP5553_08311 [Venustampulla echinocandica]|uniref:Heterokaryon incompatibility domain-containing protein n=1 Tax=Venustampulla echinocandica TaxID=2656787 RepID=A0A370TGC9_9HELO|nr:uncharacterized protein BP5553_08311 [Venustampulla echinocandica]RDL33943.1 hypothetical protein BP5553_08311 [Venustampulla echinocandica]